MQKSYLILPILGILILAGCTHDKPVVTNQATTSAEKVQQSIIVDSTNVNKLPTYNSKPENTTSTTNVAEGILNIQGEMDNTFPETDLKIKIQNLIGVDISHYTLRASLQNEYNRSKGDTNITDYTILPYVQQEFNTENIHIYTINPFKKVSMSDGCEFDMRMSNCINFIVDTHSKKVIFSDIDTEYAGSFETFDIKKKIAYFSEIYGDGNSCSWGAATTHKAVIIESGELITRVNYSSGQCNNKDCDCSNNENDWIETQKITYTKSGKEIPETPEIREIFEFIKK